MCLVTNLVSEGVGGSWYQLAFPPSNLTVLLLKTSNREPPAAATAGVTGMPAIRTVISQPAKVLQTQRWGHDPGISKVLPSDLFEAGCL